jgi:hypothetical protein
MAQLGFTSNRCRHGSVQTAFRGNDRFKFKEGGEEYPINVRMDQADRRTSTACAG